MRAALQKLRLLAIIKGKITKTRWLILSKSVSGALTRSWGAALPCQSEVFWLSPMHRCFILVAPNRERAVKAESRPLSRWHQRLFVGAERAFPALAPVVSFALFMEFCASATGSRRTDSACLAVERPEPHVVDSPEIVYPAIQTVLAWA
jgi:hypothetical protein